MEWSSLQGLHRKAAHMTQNWSRAAFMRQEGISHQEARLTVDAYCRRRDLMSPSYIKLSHKL